MELSAAVEELKQAIRAQAGGAEVTLMDDEVLYKFAACRRFEMQSAAKRYLNFIKLFQEYELSFEETPEITKCLARGIVYPGRFDKQGHPMLIAVPRNVDWKVVATKDMQKTWFFCVWKTICSSPLAQSEGIVLLLIARGVGVSMFNREFHSFVGKAVQECMPMKVRKLFVVNQPWIFSSVLWPLVSVFFSTKIRERMVFVGRNYDLLRDAVAVESIPPELQQELVLENEPAEEQT